MADGFKFNCPLCSQHIRAFEEHIGSHLQCPGCHKTITIPDPLDDFSNGDRLVQYKHFEEDEIFAVLEEGRDIHDIAIGLTHNKYWQFVLASELLFRSLSPLKRAVLNVGREQAQLEEFLLDHDPYIQIIEQKANEFFGILYMLGELINNQVLPNLQQDSVIKIVDTGKVFDAALQRLIKFNDSVYETALPPDYPYPELQGIMKGWCQFCWQGVNQFAELLHDHRIQRRAKLHGQQVQVTISPPTLSQFFIALTRLPKDLTIES